jgi:hypothetical protein
MDMELPELPSGPPALPVVGRYATRNHAFASATTWSLVGGALIIENAKQPVGRIPRAKVVSRRLEFAPTRPEPNRFRCRLTLRGGEVLEWFNRTYRGVYDFADTSAEYVACVQAVHGELGRWGPDCRFVAGASVGSYAVNLIILAVLAVGLLVALVFFLSVGLVWVALVKIVLIAFYTPTAIRWAKRNRPQGYDADAIPAAVMPNFS